MWDKRIRTRISLDGQGEGEIAETGQRFQFEAKNFTVAGLQILVAKEQSPGLGESVRLFMELVNLEGEVSSLNLNGTIRRIFALPEGALCGVRLDNDLSEETQAILEDAYLERYIDELA